SDATRLSPEAIEEIRNAQNNISDARHIMYEVIHTEHSGNNRDGANSHIRLNTVTSKRKDKAKGESSPVEKNKIVNSFKDDTSRRESDLNKLLNITGNIVTHPIFSL
ncbi:33451_t:CDS:2, partial [Gigaspora margarita]